MAREHEAGRSSFLEILRFTKRERDNIVNKMDDLKSKALLQRDKSILLHLLDAYGSGRESTKAIGQIQCISIFLRFF